jgi:hypothetical protein
MTAEALEAKLLLRPVDRGAAGRRRLRRREVARLIAAIEQGRPVDRAIALVGIDRAVGARRVLRALESWGGWPTSSRMVSFTHGLLDDPRRSYRS